jgi:signal transduction histidine kinase
VADEEAHFMNILILDGNRVSRKVYSKILLKHFNEECNLIEANTGQRGLQLIDSMNIRCTLSDYTLPDMSAVSLLQQLRMRHPYQPVVILTGEGDEESAVEAMKAGAQDYIVKGRFASSLLATSMKKAIERMDLEEELETKRKDLERTNRELRETNIQLKETRDQLVEAAHKAGMAEIATGVMHNIGNNLNSVNTCVEEIRRILTNSRLQNLEKANQMLGQFSEVIEAQPKGKQLMAYYKQLETQRDKESKALNQELGGLENRIKMIRDDVLSQQSYARNEFFLETIDITTLVEEALMLQQNSFEKEGVRVTKQFETIPQTELSRNKLIQVLTGLFRNSRESMQVSENASELHISIFHREKAKLIEIVVTDTGLGIPEKDREKIFNYGFSTKRNHHGIGLHVAANNMRELEGNLRVMDSPSGKGAAFSLTLPIK